MATLLVESTDTTNSDKNSNLCPAGQDNSPDMSECVQIQAPKRMRLESTQKVEKHTVLDKLMVNVKDDNHDGYNMWEGNSRGVLT